MIYTFNMRRIHSRILRTPDTKIFGSPKLEHGSIFCTASMYILVTLFIFVYQAQLENERLKYEDTYDRLKRQNEEIHQEENDFKELMST